MIAKLTNGLTKLCLSHCGLTSKGVNQVAHSLSMNPEISNTLTHLDLSGNNLKDDIIVSVFIKVLFIIHNANILSSLLEP